MIDPITGTGDLRGLAGAYHDRVLGLFSTLLRLRAMFVIVRATIRWLAPRIRRFR